VSTQALCQCEVLSIGSLKQENIYRQHRVEEQTSHTDIYIYIIVIIININYCCDSQPDSLQELKS
jgi:hypothetical protein